MTPEETGSSSSSAPSSEGRVVLREGSDKARVVVGRVEFERVGIVTAARDEDAEPALAGLEGNVVLLREGASAAVARVGGERHELPIYQAKDDGEIRVRVEGVRAPKEKGAPKGEAKAGLLSRLRRK